MSPGSLSFAKLAMMSSAPAKSAGDARYASQDPFILLWIDFLIQSRLQSVLGVRSFYVEHNNMKLEAKRKVHAEQILPNVWYLASEKTLRTWTDIGGNN